MPILVTHFSYDIPRQTYHYPTWDGIWEWCYFFHSTFDYFAFRRYSRCNEDARKAEPASHWTTPQPSRCWKTSAKLPISDLCNLDVYVPKDPSTLNKARLDSAITPKYAQYKYTTRHNPKPAHQRFRQSLRHWKRLAKLLSDDVCYLMPSPWGLSTLN